MSVVRTVSVDAAGGGMSHGSSLDFARRYKRTRGGGAGGGAVRIRKGKMPFRRFKEVAVKRIHTFIAGQQFETTLNANTGFGGLGHSIQFGVTGQGMVYAIAAQAPANIPNGFIANVGMYQLFDTYRIKEVQISMAYSANQVATSSNTHSLPIFYCVEDQDNLLHLTSANQALGYGTCKTIQFGDSSLKYLTMKAPTVPIAANTVSASQFSIQKRSPWIDCEQQAIVHNGLKIWYATPLASSSQQATITWTFQIVIECKGLK